MIAMITWPNEVPRWFPDWNDREEPGDDRQDVDDGDDDAGGVAAAEQAPCHGQLDEAEHQDGDADDEDDEPLVVGELATGARVGDQRDEAREDVEDSGDDDEDAEERHPAGSLDWGRGHCTALLLDVG